MQWEVQEVSGSGCGGVFFYCDYVCNWIVAMAGGQRNALMQDQTNFIVLDSGYVDPFV